MIIKLKVLIFLYFSMKKTLVESKTQISNMPMIINDGVEYYENKSHSNETNEHEYDANCTETKKEFGGNIEKVIQYEKLSEVNSSVYNETIVNNFNKNEEKVIDNVDDEMCKDEENINDEMSNDNEDDESNAESISSESVSNESVSDESVSDESVSDESVNDESDSDESSISDSDNEGISTDFENTESEEENNVENDGQKILGLTVYNNERTFIMKWPGIDQPQLVSTSIVRQLYPLSVLRFYESKLLLNHRVNL